MPLFIDSHDMNDFSEKILKKIANMPIDKHGVKLLELLFTKKENKMFCVLEGPDKEAIEKHHKDTGLTCEFIFEVTQVKPESISRTERLREMGELSARVAHDLRNPLGVIKNAVELMEMTSKDSTDEKMKKRITIIKNAVDKMLHEITDVLDMVRTRPLERKKNSLLGILESSLKETVPDQIRVIKPENDIAVFCDSQQMEVAFTNLITNAVEAIKDNGEIKIRIKDNQTYAIVEIEDSGPGIPEENIQHIFDPLFTTKSSGTGLGLVSCKNIIEQHGGKIIVNNNPTTFVIKLPKK